MGVNSGIAAEQRAIVAHSDNCGLDHPQFFQAPAGANENHRSTTNLFRPIRGLNHFANIVPTVVTVGHFLTLLRSYFVLDVFPQLSLWATIVRHSVAEMAAIHFINFTAPLRLCVKIKP